MLMMLVGTTPLICPSARMRNICVEGREVKCFNAIAGGEGPRLYAL